MMRPLRAVLSAMALASFTLAGSAFAQDTDKPTADPAPAPAAPVSAPAPGVVVSGVIEANYTANFNQPHTKTNYGYYFNAKEGQFSLNLAEIQISKAATPTSRAGFNVKLVEGEVRRLNFISEDTDSNFVLEAYGTLLIPVGSKDLKFDAGQFETHVGYETVEIGTNNFFSHNYLFGIPSPFYNAGVRASYPVSDKFTLSGYIYNRYNGRTDSGNRDLAPGFQMVYGFSPSSSLVFNGLASRENISTDLANPNNKQQNVLDLIYTNQPNPQTKFALEGLYRFGKDATDDSYNFFGVAGYAVRGSFGLRVEYLADTKNNFILGANDPGNAGKKTNLGSATLSFEPKSGLFPGARTILEARYDFANTNVFAKKDSGDFGKNQFTLTLGQVYSF